MRAARWSGALLLLVVTAGCTRDNPAYLGPPDDAGAQVDAAEQDSATGEDSGPPTCTPGTSACLGRILLACGDEGTWAPAQECPSLCVPGDSPHCGGFFPSNALAKCGHEETFDTYVAPGGAPITIDTDDFTIGGVTWTAHVEVVQTDAPPIAVFQFGSFEVPAGAHVVAVGKRALAIWAARDVVIAGGLRAGGSVSSPLPVVRTPAGAWTPDATWAAGAGGIGTEGSGFGGGGHGAGGGGGGQGPPPDPEAGGEGGTGFGSDTLAPLRGGSPGGGVLSNRAVTAGGGAIQIVACRSFSLRAGGVVSANGQGGAPGSIGYNGAYVLHGGDGGGSGGAILIESPLLHYAAVIAANGGGGGGGASLISTSPDPGLRGEDGREDDAAAAGGAAGSASAGAGGGGGVRSATQGGGGGAPSVAGAFTAGGGGGGVGRTRLNVTKLDGPDLGIKEETGHLLTPTPSYGQLEMW
jgi:hypothetical protein